MHPPYWGQDDPSKNLSPFNYHVNSGNLVTQCCMLEQIDLLMPHWNREGTFHDSPESKTKGWSSILCKAQTETKPWRSTMVHVKPSWDWDRELFWVSFPSLSIPRIKDLSWLSSSLMSIIIPKARSPLVHLGEVTEGSIISRIPCHWCPINWPYIAIVNLSTVVLLSNHTCKRRGPLLLYQAFQ